MNLYKKNMLKHAIPMNPRRHHKYLYIDANGNYVYPEDVARKAGDKAKALNAKGQANAVNMRKERAERIKAGNSRMAAKLKGVYDQGQANNANARKARAESINSGNERIANSKAYKIGKTIFGETKAGKELKRLGKHANNVRDEFTGVELPKGNKVKPRQKTPEEIAREDAELERRVSEGMTEFAAKYAEDYYKEQAKKKADKLPEGWVRDQNGYVYDDIRAMAVDPNDPAYKKKKKRAKKNVAKVVKTSVAHSDTYRSNVMNSHQRKIYASQLQHAERRNHKYLYKIGDRYIYPEDVAGKAKGAIGGFKDRAAAAIAEQKQKHKDKKFVKESEKLKKKDVADEYDSYDEWLKAVNKHNAATDKGKQVNQISSAHTRSTVGMGTHLLSYQKGEHDTTANLEKQKAKTAARKRPYDEKARDAGFQAEMERRQATIDARNAGRLKTSVFAHLVKAEEDTAKRKVEKEEKIRKRKEKTNAQIKSAHTYDGGRSNTPGYRKAIHDTNVRKMKNPKTAAEAERRLASEHDDQSVYWAKQRIEVDRPYKKQDKNFSKVETKTVVNNPVKNKSVEVKDTSVKPITIKENTLKENVIRENTDKGFNKGLTMTENERFRRGYTVSKKPKKKKTKAQRRSELTGQR